MKRQFRRPIGSYKSYLITITSYNLKETFQIASYVSRFTIARSSSRQITVHETLQSVATLLLISLYFFFSSRKKRCLDVLDEHDGRFHEEKSLS